MHARYIANGQWRIYDDEGNAIRVVIASEDHTPEEILASVEPPSDEELEKEKLNGKRAGMEVTRFQAKAALSAAGLLPLVEEAIAKGDEFIRLAWQEAQSFRRMSPTILELGKALKLTDDQLDALFEAAAQIQA